MNQSEYQNCFFLPYRQQNKWIRIQCAKENQSSNGFLWKGNGRSTYYNRIRRGECHQRFHGLDIPLEWHEKPVWIIKSSVRFDGRAERQGQTTLFLPCGQQLFNTKGDVIPLHQRTSVELNDRRAINGSYWKNAYLESSIGGIPHEGRPTILNS